MATETVKPKEIEVGEKYKKMQNTFVRSLLELGIKGVRFKWCGKDFGRIRLRLGKKKIRLRTANLSKQDMSKLVLTLQGK